MGFVRVPRGHAHMQLHRTILSRRPQFGARSGHHEPVIPALVLVAGIVALPSVALWIWRLQTRVMRSLVPGADLADTAALADLPVNTALGPPPPRVTGPPVHLLALTREAASLFVAYRPVASAAATVTTLLLDLASAGNRELAVLTRWHAALTPVMVGFRPGDVEVAIQEPKTRLTVTLPVLA
jgi:hypothetical protein